MASISKKKNNELVISSTLLSVQPFELAEIVIHFDTKKNRRKLSLLFQIFPLFSVFCWYFMPLFLPVTVLHLLSIAFCFLNSL